MDTLLVEIGSEEIPAGYIQPALNALAAGIDRKLTEARIDHGAVTTAGTPRRLVVTVAEVAPKQASLSTEMTGPPESVGSTMTGRPTVAAEKFAEKVGVSLKAVAVKETPKGRYLCARKRERGRATRTLLKEILPDVVLATPFPKTMRWGELDVSFARPIQTLVALLGKQVVTFAVGNIRSGRYALGHRFMHKGKIKIEYTGDLCRTAAQGPRARGYR
jgi:glycyl-tRNA synthetase beta chain